MAIIVTKEIVDTPKPGYISLFINPDGHLSSKDDQGLVRTFSEGVISFAATEPFTMNVYQLAQKSIELAYQPLPGSIKFRIYGCLDQIENEGFYVDGKTIRWDNYGLDGFLDQADLIQIFYSYFS